MLRTVNGLSFIFRSYVFVPRFFDAAALSRTKTVGDIWIIFSSGDARRHVSTLFVSKVQLRLGKEVKTG